MSDSLISNKDHKSLPIKRISAVLIWSENYQALVNWYQEKLDLTIQSTEHHPKDTGVNFQLGDTILWIGKHSKVVGTNKDPHRIMFNLVVDSVQETYELLKTRGVEFIASPFKAFTFDKYFATFHDLDGNIVQLIGEK